MPIIPPPLGSIPPQTYDYLTLAEAQLELGTRLNDPNMRFWPPAELTIHIQNALRFWNALTGDQQSWYQLAVQGTPTVWYDLQQIVGSPRIAALTEQNLYSWMQYALLEPQAPLAALATGQFLTADLVSAVQRKRDEFLFRTGATGTVRLQPVVPNTPTVNLLEATIEARRAYWLPNTGGGWPIFRGDEWVTSAWGTQGPSTPSDPATFSAGTVPPLTLTLDPPPSQPGLVELITLETQQPIAPNTTTAMFLPTDFVPAIYWGALADLTSNILEQSDPLRSVYAQSRFDQYCELLTTYPFVLGARVNNVPVQVDAVETLDIWQPMWRSLAVTNPTAPPILAVSGQNLVAYPSPTPTNIALLMVGNAIVPVAAGDFIQQGPDVIDAILDYAQHCALWKIGGEEFTATMPLFKSIVLAASKRNARVRAMATFRDLLYGRSNREDQIQPQIKEVEGAS